MEITTLCAVVASLGIVPNRSQFFQYESVSFNLNCGNPSGWRVKRTTSRQMNQDCPASWGREDKTSCHFEHLYEMDSGVYWCESEEGDHSNAINITVTAGALILESPALPVMEGEAVILKCITKTPSQHLKHLLTEFYKDELLLESSSTGSMTLERVSRSDEGLYKCNISGFGESPNSWLTVRGHPELPHSAAAYTALPVMVVMMSLILLMLLNLTLNCEDEFTSTLVMYTRKSHTWKHCGTGWLQKKRSSPSYSVAEYTPVSSPAQVWTHRAYSCDSNRSGL